jgi:trigger factor|tara:strand:- start:89 stop:1564 length:1476 start_codon:yes stop_codon:yes gene_type:complete
VKITLTELDPSELEEAPAATEETSNEAESTAPTRTYGPKIKLSIEVDEETFESAIDDAFKKISKEIRVPGFRQGKVPRAVLESRIGNGYARAQALEDAIPNYYADAVRTESVDVIAAPELKINGGEESGPVSFEATVEIRPVIEIEGYDKLEVTIPNPSPTDDEIQEQIDMQRGQSAELVDVDRPAATGDQVSIDISGTVDGEALPGLTAQDYLYEVGSEGIAKEVDVELQNATAGSELSFSAAHPVQENVSIDFEITVHAVKEKVLPELTDEWVDENTESETVEELREQIKTRTKMMKSFQANSALRENTAQALAELVTQTIPDSMVNGEMSDQIQQLAMRLQGQGMSIESWLQMTGQDPESFTVELREAAERSAKVDLALRAIVLKETIEASEEDLNEELERMATQFEVTIEELRHQITDHGDGLGPVKAELVKRKALEKLVAEVKLIDEDGIAVSREDLELQLPETDKDEADKKQNLDADNESKEDAE